jgi:hypothetical protein
MQVNGVFQYAQIVRPVENDFTLEAWIQMNSNSLLAIPPGPDFWEGNGLIYDDIARDDNDYGLSILDNRLTFGIGLPDTTLQGTSVLALHQWVHVAATRLRTGTGSQLRVYVNGNLDGTLQATNGNPLNAQSLFTIGGNTVDGRYFDGLMDEVRIWNVARTQAEIASTMNQRLSGSEPGLVAYYRFDEPGAPTAVDSSPSHFDAQLVGVGWLPSEAPICQGPPDAAPPDSGIDAPDALQDALPTIDAPDTSGDELPVIDAADVGASEGNLSEAAEAASPEEGPDGASEAGND